MDKKYVKLGDLGGSKEIEVEGLSGKVREVARSSSAPGARGGLSRSVSPAKRLKRACVMDECVRESGNEELSSMSMIGEKLRKFLFAEGNRVSKSVSEFVLGCVSEYEMQLMKMVSKNERLCGRLEECEKNAVRSVNVCAQKSFASVAAKGVSVTKNVPVSVSVSVREKSYAWVVKPKDEAQKMTSEEVKKKVMSSVRESVNIRVKVVRKTRRGGLAIVTATEQDLIVLRECKKFAEVGLKVEPSKKIGSKVVVFDVPNDMTSEKLLKGLYSKHLESEGVSMNEMNERVRLWNRMNRKGVDVGNVVIEVK